MARPLSLQVERVQGFPSGFVCQRREADSHRLNSVVDVVQTDNVEQDAGEDMGGQDYAGR